MSNKVMLIRLFIRFVFIRFKSLSLLFLLNGFNKQIRLNILFCFFEAILSSFMAAW